MTPLFHRVGTQQAFKFLHTLQAQLSEINVPAYYYVDPTAHDQQTINLISNLVEATIRIGHERTVEGEHADL